MAMLEPLVKAIQMICDKLEQLEEKVENLDKLVTDEIIGGITTLYNEKSRMGGIGEMTEKYKDKFDPYKDFYSSMTDGSDLYEKLYDEINSMKGDGSAWNEESEGSAIEGILGQLKAKHDKIKGTGEPVGVSVEIEKTSTNEDGLDKIRAMRKKNPEVRF